MIVVKGLYVNTNKKMIQNFLADFKKLDETEFLSSILQTENGKIFVHTSQLKRIKEI